MSEKFVIDSKVFRPGENGLVQLAVGRLPSDTLLSVQVYVFRSKNPGPTTLLLGGVHGDEINGVEILRRVLSNKVGKDITKGSIIVIPLLNVYGFINFNRYVPDGKDVNRSFPGTKNGSLASRIAGTLTRHILPLVDYIFDFHTGGDSRYNYPQIRYSPTDNVAKELASVFGAKYIIQSGIIVKSLRKIARDFEIPILVYEGGESTRLNESAINMGYDGLMRCLHHMGHISSAPEAEKNDPPILIKKTTWIRASFSGLFLWTTKSGTQVVKGDKLGSINDPSGQKSVSVIAHKDGYIIGHNNASVVNQGDALFHLGYETEILDN
jgi:predicted deacylase